MEKYILPAIFTFVAMCILGLGGFAISSVTDAVDSLEIKDVQREGEFAKLNTQVDNLFQWQQEFAKVDLTTQKINEVRAFAEDIKERKQAHEKLTADHRRDGHPATLRAELAEMHREIAQHAGLEGHAHMNARMAQMIVRISEIETQIREERGIRFQGINQTRMEMNLPPLEYLPKGRDTLHD